MEALDLHYMLTSAWHALGIVMDPNRLFFLWIGVVVGLLVGLLPGIGGLTGFALLLPFTYTMDPFAAFAMLLGMHSVTATADVIPAVLMGVPGGVASQATVLDGFAMARKGEGGRALSASYFASLLGGLVGALLLGLTIPILRPFVMQFGTPEMLAVLFFGIAMVSSLSGTAPLRGLVAAGFGILISLIGTDPHTGTMRWTFDSIYLWEGLPLLPVLLGLYALPELCDLAIQRSAVADEIKYTATQGMLKGIQDVLKNWWLVLRCSTLSAVLGAVPGISGAVIDWIAYAHALRSEKGARESFGKGDVRGVIAPESANNAKEGGGLVTMIAFGVPHGAGTAILMGALIMHGFIPGPDMLTKHLDVTYSLVWSIAVANIVGAGICFLLSGQLAKLSTLRYTLMLPLIMVIVYVGAFQGHQSWGDLYSLLVFGVLGWIMKHLKWPRPPLILGLILGSLVERYLFLSIGLFGSTWIYRPIVIVLFAMGFLTLLIPFFREIRNRGGYRNIMTGFGRPIFTSRQILPVVLMCVIAFLMYEAQDWYGVSKLVPQVVGTASLVLCALSLFNDVFSGDRAKLSEGGVHMDLAADVAHLTPATVAFRGAVFFLWTVAFLVSMYVVGLIPSVPIYIIAYMRLEAREPWKLTLTIAACMTAFIYIVFDQFLSIAWLPTLLGSWFPALKAIPSL